MVFETLHLLYDSCDRRSNAADKAVEIAKLVKNKNNNFRWCSLNSMSRFIKVVHSIKIVK